MRFFALAAMTKVCGMLTAAAPTAAVDVVPSGGVAHHSGYNDTQAAHTSKSETIILALGTNGINVGNSQTLYHDVQAAISQLCLPNGEGCFNAPYTFPVWVTSLKPGLNPGTNPNPYLSRSRKTIIVFVEDAEWGGRGNVYEVLRSTIAAAFERGTYDPGNCVTQQLFPGVKDKGFEDCITIDYAAVVLSGGYKMKVRFGGPGSQYKDLKFDCGRVVDDAFAFVRDEVEWKGTPWVYCI